MSIVTLTLWLAAAQTAGAPEADAPIACGMCDEWNQEQEPFRIFGDTYYVGVRGLSVLLIATDDGLILLDGALPQSVPLIDANIRKLGFRTEDVRLIVNSHAHFDHAGGIAALQRASGATVATSPRGAEALREGMATPDDPQHGFGDSDRFPPIADVRTVADGETLRVGGRAITVHFTPGHTPGGTTWTWRSCEGARCVDMVYADSLTAVSAPGFRFTGGPDSPGVVDVLRRSIRTVAELPCDLMVSTHPGFSGLFDKLKSREGGEKDALIDPDGCRAYAAGAEEALARRIAEETSDRP